MDFDLGTDVYSRDGKHVGKVDRIVLREPDGEVQDLVIHKGFFFPRDVVVPVDKVTAVDEKGVHLVLDTHDLDALPDFIEEEYGYLPTTSPSRINPMGGVMYPRGIDPSVAPMIVGEVKRLPPGADDFARGYLVRAVDSGEIGVVHDIVADSESGDVEYLIVDGTDQDLGRIHVPVSLIGQVTDEEVTLTVPLDAIRALASTQHTEDARS